MRSYPHNSPQAAARIVALMLLADDHLCQYELDRLAQLDAHRRLGLTQAELLAVAQAVCEDRKACADLAWGGGLDEYTLRELLSELSDPVLRSTVFQLCHAVAHADEQPAEAEAAILRLAFEQWRLPLQDLAPISARPALQPA
jgi:uncharacterized tellurite resistance protein B-like protein